MHFMMQRLILSVSLIMPFFNEAYMFSWLLRCQCHSGLDSFDGFIIMNKLPPHMAHLPGENGIKRWKIPKLEVYFFVDFIEELLMKKVNRADTP